MKTKVQVHPIETEQEFQELATEWNLLLDSSSAASIFLSWEWISAWWSVFGAGKQLCVLAARDENRQLVGLAPLMLARGKKIWNRYVNYLSFIGQRGDTLAEYLDFIVQRGRESEVIGAFASFLLDAGAARWDVIDFELTLENSVCLHEFQRVLGDSGILVKRTNLQMSPFLTLPATWDEFLSGKSRNFRSQWRNAWNRLEGIGEVRVIRAGHDLSLNDAMDQLIRLNRQRWGEVGGSFRTSAYVSFHRQLCSRFHESGNLLFLLLEVDGKIVAARYDFLGHKKIWCFQGGWDPAFENCRIGTIMTGMVIQWGIDHACSEYDFLTGPAAYKDRWSTDSRRLVDRLAFRPGWRGRMARNMEQLRDRIRKVGNRT